MFSLDVMYFLPFTMAWMFFILYDAFMLRLSRPGMYSLVNFFEKSST